MHGALWNRPTFVRGECYRLLPTAVHEMRGTYQAGSVEIMVEALGVRHNAQRGKADNGWTHGCQFITNPQDILSLHLGQAL